MENNQKNNSKTIIIVAVVSVVLVLFIIILMFAGGDSENNFTNQTIVNEPVTEEKSYIPWLLLIAIVLICGGGVILYFFKKKQLNERLLNVSSLPEYPVKRAKELITKQLVDEYGLNAMISKNKTKVLDGSLKFKARRITNIKGVHYLMQYFVLTKGEPGHHLAFIPLVNDFQIMSENYDFFPNFHMMDINLMLRKFPKHYTVDAQERIAELRAKAYENLAEVDPTTILGAQRYQQEYQNNQLFGQPQTQPVKEAENA